MPLVKIGCSGFNYPHWKGTFYPEHLPQKKWFQYYCTKFSAVELNVTFYRLPRPEVCDKWYQETPPDFVFSIKGSRYITHVKKLNESKEPVERFFENTLYLKEKLKAVLWQLPPSFKINIERLRTFINVLQAYPVKSVLEFRHESWVTKDISDLCEEHNISLCMADWPEYIDELPVTSDLVYMRRHGKGGRYDSRYSKAALKRDAKRIKGYLKEKKDILLFFNNDAFGYAPENAQELVALL